MKLFSTLFFLKEKKRLASESTFSLMNERFVFGESINAWFWISVAKVRQRKGWQNGATYGRKTSKRTP